MTRERHIPRRRRASQIPYVEPQNCVPCTRKIAATFLKNLEHAARDRLSRERARRAKEIRDQIEVKQAVVDRRKPDGQPPAGSPPTPAAPEQRMPQARAGRWNRVKSAVQQGLKAVAQRAWTFRLRGRTRG